MKRSELKELLLDLGVDAEVIKSIANPLVSAIGEKNNALLERKKTEWESSLPKSEELVAGKLKELGFDSIDSIKNLQSKYDEANGKIEANNKAEKDKLFNSHLAKTLKSFNIDDSKSTLISKLLDKTDLYSDEGEFDTNILSERVKSTVSEYLPELTDFESVKEIEFDPVKVDSERDAFVASAARLRKRR